MTMIMTFLLSHTLFQLLWMLWGKSLKVHKLKALSVSVEWGVASRTPTIMRNIMEYHNSSFPGCWLTHLPSSSLWLPGDHWWLCWRHWPQTHRQSLIQPSGPVRHEATFNGTALLGAAHLQAFHHTLWPWVSFVQFWSPTIFRCLCRILRAFTQHQGVAKQQDTWNQTRDEHEREELQHKHTYFSHTHTHTCKHTTQIL